MSTSSPITVSGPPVLAKVVTAVAAVVGAASLDAWPNPVAISVTVLAAMVAWRLSQLAIIIEGDDLVVRNLFATSRIPLASAEVQRVNTDLRTRTAWGGHAISGDFIPKMDDDNMTTNATLVRINDRSNSDRSVHTDCSLGLLPKAQDALFAKLQNAITLVAR